MSITVFVKTEAGVWHDVEVAGTEMVGSLYKKVASAAGLLEGMFKLVFEENVLSMFGGGEVQESGLVEGSEVKVVPGTVVGLTDLKKSPETKEKLERLVAAYPDLVLEVDVGDSPDSVVCIGKHDLPSGLRGLLVTDSTNRARDIGDDFLRGSTLTSLALRLELSTIGFFFLSGSSLLHIDFGDESFFTKFITIGDKFLAKCFSLQSVSFNFTNVTSIGAFFLFGCFRLQSVDLNGLINVTSIGHFFLGGCSGLQSVNLSSFTNVTSIGRYFLYRCPALRIIEDPSLPEEHALRRATISMR
eukprot:TRINITY_DN2747_c0_g1_i5.p1 TRINITY_DN2747_c0_g1~~TRINITY_DN2747_c0_g1_i5.p1  ORF type:complete len:316 (+),score=66.90 TRINITY_DN2747_c0_g1_i5:47-949(+)